MRELSDWQLMRVRDALRAYHRYQRNQYGRYYTWMDVREDIAHYTGVKIGSGPKYGAERLRQFVEGIETRESFPRRKYPVPKPEALEGIVALLTHEEVKVLNEDELSEYAPGFQAPLRLIEYLAEDCDTPMTFEARTLEGVLKTDHPNGDGWLVRRVTLQRADTEGMLQVVEFREQFLTESAEQAVEWSNQNHYENRTGFVKYGGWAVITPEDSIMLFLKHSVNGRNVRYFGLDELGLLFDSPGLPHVKNLRFLQHDFGYDLRTTDRIPEIVAALADDTFVFEWMPLV
ncbi:MAG: hypothetical protein KZQ94_01140 [Candidatus Thiodiazotropha sp. (ex Troendleina suluensis)]|nr:hypothetical protein [Candidatus Thiodiazotropha sp. (ex Troendleina suluensis)]